jgi:hypothetical protein
MVRADDLSNRSDVYLLCELENLLRGDECGKPLVDELRRRMYRLRLDEMMYHVDTYLAQPPACQQK